MKPLESLLRVFVELHPEDAARAFDTLDPAEALRLFKNLPVHLAVSLLERISPYTAKPVLEQLGSERLRELLQAMSPRAASIVVQQLEESVRNDVLAGLPPETAKPLRELSQYPTDTAGSIMEPRVASLPIDLTVQQAITRIRKTPREALHYLYITARDGKLIGVLSMRDLLLAAPRDPLEKLVIRNVLALPDTMDREEVVEIMRERGFVALPVVDYENRLVGVVKHADIIEAGQLEAYEDMQKSVGVAADERALSPLSRVIKSRLPWLYVNLATAFMAAAVVGMFEDIIAQMAVLAVLLPVVAGQGGNTGSQSLAIVMRGLALREIMPGVKRRVIVKELLGGLFNGIAVAVVTAAIVFAWRKVAGDSASACGGLALVIGLSMTVNMAAAALSGAVIPLLLQAVGRDPAQSASIFLTTVTDIVGFAAFLGCAVLFKPMIL